MSQISVNQPKNFLRNPLSWLSSFWNFSRPHTIIGTSLSVFALYLIALATFKTEITFNHITELLGALIACLCGNIYIVGLNQLEDIKIDQINKPYLPLASGDFSLLQGRLIVGISGVFALIIAFIFGFWLGVTVAISLIIGTAYSLPPIRLKQFPFLAALCIFTVRGVIVNLGLFLYFSNCFINTSVLVPTVWILTAFVVVFTVAIAIFKDVPDLEGDKEYNITTFTIILGKSTIFKITYGIILFCYLGIIAIGFLQISNINGWVLILSHLSLLGLLSWRSQRVDLEDKDSIARFYQFIWKLFFLEYLLFPIACFFH
ncbi:homogentisate phytyltransferase [Crocosphaera sp. UHCC 0190]|uniref:homogentisate phytyltransferase n=1 Tax=Crocosphaera sp. UHCC 0190 TaxID=3110246 RepID=UPI002B20F3EC|nr:homogentisate phytyltransferase [Crocosphaera sp. UHCC 0190]MEA5509287.1 homogentisate phytyltransferase [Crocosphaera sp. UHCC 0190]